MFSLDQKYNDKDGRFELWAMCDGYIYPAYEFESCTQVRECVISGCFPDIHLPSQWTDAVTATPAEKSSRVNIPLFMRAHLARKINTEYYDPPLIMVVHGCFPDVAVYASEHGSIWRERENSMTGALMYFRQLHKDGSIFELFERKSENDPSKERNQERPTGSAPLACIILRDEKGRDCKLPESGAFFFYKAGRTRVEGKMQEVDVRIKMEVPASASRLTPIVLSPGIKGRVSRAKVVSITSRSNSNVQFDRAWNRVYCGQVLEYNVGSEVVPDGFNNDASIECGAGIHGCLYEDQCDYWFDYMQHHDSYMNSLNLR